jgi:hypothetical protein
MGGNRLDRPGYFLEPTILTDITPENPAFHVGVHRERKKCAEVVDKAQAPRGDTSLNMTAFIRMISSREVRFDPSDAETYSVRSRTACVLDPASGELRGDTVHFSCSVLRSLAY